jgi:hypothetical protein
MCFLSRAVALSFSAEIHVFRRPASLYPPVLGTFDMLPAYSFKERFASNFGSIGCLSPVAER